MRLMTIFCAVLLAAAVAQAKPQQRIDFFTLHELKMRCPCTAENADFSFKASRSVDIPDAQDTIFAIMKARYRSTEQIFEDGLDIDVSRTREQNFRMDEEGKCMYGELSFGTLNIDGVDYNVSNLKVGGFALENGVETAICNCKDEDLCSGPLRERIEARMQAVKDTLEKP